MAIYRTMPESNWRDRYEVVTYTNGRRDFAVVQTFKTRKEADHFAKSQREDREFTVAANPDGDLAKHIKFMDWAVVDLGAPVEISKYEDFRPLE